MTRPYAEVIGDPIAHSKSPLIHNFWLQKLGIDAEYRACHVRADELEEYFTRRREDAKWRGSNVTIPHKRSVAPFVTTMSREASQIGAVNCAYEQQGRIVGYNSDVDGVLEALASKRKIDGGTACVVGTGGAARAALYVLQQFALNDVLILSRSVERATKLAHEFDVFGVGVPLESEAPSALCGCDILINASPLGMIGQDEMSPKLLSGLASMSKGALVFDMVYAPIETSLLCIAKEEGLATVDGLTMLIGQAAEAFRLFFGERAPREHDAELRALLTA